MTAENKTEQQPDKFNRFTSQAIINLFPESAFVVTPNEIIWQEGTPLNRPTDEQIIAEQNKLKAEWDALEYQRKREKEYPDPRVYLDAVVKGDQEAIQAYIDACLAVKAKYPKPEGV